MPKRSKKLPRAVSKIFGSLSRADLVAMVREEMLGLPELPRDTKQRANPTAARQKKKG